MTNKSQKVELYNKEPEGDPNLLNKQVVIETIDLDAAAENKSIGGGSVINQQMP